MNILITGATGLIGGNLARQLAARGHELAYLSRRAGQAETLVGAPGKMIQWNAATGALPQEGLGDCEAVIHLAGEPVAGRWTTERKQRIRDSRVQGTQKLVRALGELPKPPKVLVAASAVGFYGDRADEVLSEQATQGKGFLADVCAEWESEIDKARSLGMRVVIVRIGVVLSPTGGALATMLPPFKLGVAGKLGSGHQWFPWIHLDDITGIFLHALSDGALSGVVNGVAPNPVTNEEFTKELAAALNRPALIPVPKFMLDLLFGEMAAVMLASQRVVPTRTTASGYQFKFPWLRPALTNVLA